MISEAMANGATPTLSLNTPSRSMNVVVTRQSSPATRPMTVTPADMPMTWPNAPWIAFLPLSGANARMRNATGRPRPATRNAQVVATRRMKPRIRPKMTRLTTPAMANMNAPPRSEMAAAPCWWVMVLLASRLLRSDAPWFLPRISAFQSLSLSLWAAMDSSKSNFSATFLIFWSLLSFAETMFMIPSPSWVSSGPSFMPLYVPVRAMEQFSFSPWSAEWPLPVARVPSSPRSLPWMSPTKPQPARMVILPSGLTAHVSHMTCIRSRRRSLAAPAVSRLLPCESLFVTSVAGQKMMPSGLMSAIFPFRE